MRALMQGVYKNGIIRFKDKVKLKEGTKVAIITETKSSIGLAGILLQQQVVKKIWDAPEEDLYGEI